MNFLNINGWSLRIFQQLLQGLRFMFATISTGGSITTWCFPSHSREHRRSITRISPQYYLGITSVSPMYHPGVNMCACKEQKPFVLVIFLAVVELLFLANAQTGIDEYLDPHNAARGVVGAPALSWSANLADYARGYAATQVSRCTPLTHSHGEYGENLFWGSAGKEWTPQDAVTAWTDEVADYDYGRNACTAGKMCGHYTQVVWKATSHVGCALVTCNDGADYIICSYDPPGNWIGERPF